MQTPIVAEALESLLTPAVQKRGIPFAFGRGYDQSHARISGRLMHRSRQAESCLESRFCDQPEKPDVRGDLIEFEWFKCQFFDDQVNKKKAVPLVAQRQPPMEPTLGVFQNN